MSPIVKTQRQPHHQSQLLPIGGNAPARPVPASGQGSLNGTASQTSVDMSTERERLQAEKEAASQKTQALAEWEADLVAREKKLAESAEAVLQKAQETGFEQGLEKAQKQEKAICQQFEQLPQKIEAAFKQWMMASEDKIIEVVFIAICRILSEEVLNRAHIVSIIQRLLGEVGHQLNCTVFLSPSDFRFFSTAMTTFTPSDNVQFSIDENLLPGGCVIETNGGTLDARLETQLSNLITVLKDALAEEKSHG